MPASCTNYDELIGNQRGLRYVSEDEHETPVINCLIVVVELLHYIFSPGPSVLFTVCISFPQ